MSPYNDIWGNGTNIFNWDTSPIIANNISSDPMSVDAAMGDYHLQLGSPCIDAGTNNVAGLPGADFDGAPRIADGNNDMVAIVDIGPFESPCHVSNEIKNDGIDQDCNGYDLTINIVSAVYTINRDKLVVDATSALGLSANLTLTGYGPMTWVSNKSKWTKTVEPAGGNPGTVTVSGVEGAESATVSVK